MGNRLSAAHKSFGQEHLHTYMFSATKAEAAMLNVLYVGGCEADYFSFANLLKGSEKFQTNASYCARLDELPDLLEDQNFDILFFAFVGDNVSALTAALQKGQILPSVPLVALCDDWKLADSDEFAEHPSVSWILNSDMSVGTIENAIFSAQQIHRLKSQFMDEKQELETALSERTETIRTLMHEVGTIVSASRSIATTKQLQALKGSDAEFNIDDDERYETELSHSIEHLYNTSQSILASADLIHQDEIAASHCIDELKASIKNIMSPFALQSGKNLRVLAHRSSARFNIDGVVFVQMAVNLITNAIKHSDEAAKINVVLLHTADKLYLTVANTGKGMDETVLNSLRKRGSRGDDSSAKTSGHGLGLSIIDDYVAHLNGKIGIYSNVESGTHIHVSVPVENI